jgi:hypothetical protein
MSNTANKTLFKLLNARPVSFNPIYSTICGKIKKSNLTGKEYLEKNQSAGILLSQFLYWYSTMNNQEFYKLDVELIEECGCSEHAYQQAKKVLIEKGFVTCEAKHPRNRETGKVLNIKTINHWIINEEMIMQEVLNSGNTGNAELSSSGNSSTQQFEEVLNSAVPIITEITTETTTESEGKPSSSPSSPQKKLEELKNQIQANPLFELWVDAIKNINQTYSTIDNIDQLALNDCALALLSDGKQAMRNPKNWLEISYKKILDTHIQNQKLAKSTQELAITEQKKGFYDSKAESKSPYSSPSVSHDDRVIQVDSVEDHCENAREESNRLIQEAIKNKIKYV